MDMSGEEKRGMPEKGSDNAGAAAEKVVVAVKAAKEIPKTALVWALTHVVQSGDCITLLVVVPSQSPGRKLWSFPRFAGDCASGHWKSYAATLEHKSDITDSFSQMILQLHDVYDPNKINVKIKIVSGSPCGAVAAEAKNAEANWVVMDKQLKQEEKRCMEELQCNIVVMKHSQPKVLRLNLVGWPKRESKAAGMSHAELNEASEKHPKNHYDYSKSTNGPVVTPNSSPDLGTSFTTTEAGTSSKSSSDPWASPYFISELTGEDKKVESSLKKVNSELDESSSDTESEHFFPSTRFGFNPWMSERLSSHHPSSKPRIDNRSLRSSDKAHNFPADKALLEKFPKLDREASVGLLNGRPNVDLHENVREAISLSRNVPLGPPPLCSICQHKAPVFGKPPRWFSYAELELATDGFSKASFLAEGGFGSVHRGILPDGQAVAVKQHKLASSQGDVEFCSEVEVLSCAQHRNVVMLIGYCIENGRRMLVYEYICNGSLDSHLWGHNQDPLEWSARQKIAVGAARGLRYLHEECRVGCIVHRDMRPNNILITHDFEPLVGDFGLARWQPDGEEGVETRVIGTFGYMAPEYAQSGQITEKADVYSFGVVLLELVTGRKAIDLNRHKGQQCLAEWARPLLEDCAIDVLIDPRLENVISEQEVCCMLHAASLCIRRDPHSRPRMSQVLRILEGDMVIESNHLSRGFDIGNHSGRIWLEQQLQQEHYSGSILSETLGSYSGRTNLASLSRGFWGRERPA